MAGSEATRRALAASYLRGRTLEDLPDAWPADLEAPSHRDRWPVLARLGTVIRRLAAEARRTYLVAMRKGLDLKQSEMAEARGMGLRAYSDLETGKSECRTIHVLAAERVTLRLAAERRAAEVLAAPVRADIAALEVARADA